MTFAVYHAQADAVEIEAPGETRPPRLQRAGWTERRNSRNIRLNIRPSVPCVASVPTKGFVGQSAPIACVGGIVAPMTAQRPGQNGS